MKGYLDDLWKYSNGTWTLISGSPTTVSTGSQGINYPGGRSGAVSCVDSAGSVWLFGGSGYDVGNSVGK